MNRIVRRAPLAKMLALFFAGSLLVTVSSCTKHPPTPPPAPKEEPVPVPPPAELPEVEVKEPPVVPPAEPEMQVENLDDVIRQQNASRQLLKTIHFDFDKSDIRDEDVPVLQANAAWMKAHTQYRITVEGHCDERDTIEYNLALGDRRARVIMQYLTDLGVSPGRLRTISYGEERPVDTGHDESAWAKNRRAEFTLEK